VGCAPDGPAKHSRVLGSYRLETFLRLACLGWLCQTLRSNARYLGVSTLHIVKIYSLDGNNFGHHNCNYDVIDNLLHTMHLSRLTQGLFEARTPTSVGAECGPDTNQ
jgi:hypothetical protein